MNACNVQPIRDPKDALREITHFIRASAEAEADGNHLVAGALHDEAERLTAHAPRETITMLRTMGLTALYPPHL